MSEPRRRLSVVRILILVLVVTGAAVTPFALRKVTAKMEAVAVASPSSFAPYVDVTATPQYAFEDPTESAAGNVVLGFVVSSTAVACQPSWGTAYSLATAAPGIDLDRRIARLRQRGGEVTVSFGGARNNELAKTCTDPAELAAAYQSVVARYRLTSVDFDIEDPTADPVVFARRAAAVRTVQNAEEVAGRKLSVWLTLPVSPNGLTPMGTAALNAMLAAKVDLAGVNALVMNYGGAAEGRSMSSLNASALTALAGQVASAYAKIGVPLSEDARWQHVAATPMIGQNDTPGDRFEPADARELLAFARARHMRQLSMWSANRDKSCGVNYADPSVVSDSCSGVQQKKSEFSTIFQTFVGTATAVAPSAAVTVKPSDDPSTSPYPIWNSLTSYAKNAKVTWKHNVYLAKWWTQGDVPDAPVVNEADTPWTLVGPVLAGETPMATPTVSAGTFPQWLPNHTYVAGDRVRYRGAGYLAKWWTVGDQPGADVKDPSDTPWQPLS